MTRQGLQRKRLPDAPGVYFFLGSRKKILYIGRATSLRNRVRSYFTADIAQKRSSWIAKMLTEAKRIDFRKTDSVLEAILIEADLIKKFRPPYNTDLKDDKSFNCVVITKEDFPRVLIVRGRDINSFLIHNSGFIIHSQYGPFPAGFHLQIAMKIIRRIFPYRDAKCTPSTEHTRPHKQHTDKPEIVSMCKPCFSRQIGLCPGVCTGEISKKDYAKTIRNLRLFFEGKKTRLLKLLEREIKAAAKKQEFERAGELKRQLFALRHIQDIALLRNNAAELRGLNAGSRRDFRIEAYDLSHFGGKDIVGAMAVVEDEIARPSEYRLFKLRSVTGPHETAGLSEILRRRFSHPEWAFPHLIVVDGNEVQKTAAEDILTELGQNIPVVAVVKNERHRPREILGAGILEQLRQSASLYPRSSAILLVNSEVHRFALKFQRSRRSLSPRVVRHRTA